MLCDCLMGRPIIRGDVIVDIEADMIRQRLTRIRQTSVSVHSDDDDDDLFEYSSSTSDDDTNLVLATLNIDDLFDECCRDCMLISK